MSRSSVALSNLRGFAIVMVVAFHAFIAYLGSQPASPLPFDAPPYAWLANPIVDSARWFGFDLFCALQYVYLMHLMFFLSGLFVWPSLSRKGARTFLYDRLVGLGIGALGLERGLLEAEGILAQRCWHWLALAAATFLLWIIPTALIVNGTTLPGLQIAADLGLLFCAAAACFALVGLFLRTTRRHRPILESLADHAYGIYFVHYVFVLWLQYILLDVALFEAANAAIVFIGAVTLSWAANAAVCSLAIGARLMGRKPRELVRARARAR